jgi:hypothetical protein
MLNMTAAVHYYYPYYFSRQFMFEFMRKLSAAQLPAAAAVDALLRLSLQLCNRPHLHHAPGAVCRVGVQAEGTDMLTWWDFLCKLPGTAQLPAAAHCELAELALQEAPMWLAAHAANQLLHPLAAAGFELPDTHLRRLLALLKGQLSLQAATAAAALRVAAAKEGYRGFVDYSVMMWLARQPGAAAAATEIGLTAADVIDVRVRDALFGLPGPAGMP